MENIHSLLKRQIKKAFGELTSFPDGFDHFFKAINDTYCYADEERKMIERSMEISSQELMQRNSEINAIFKALPDIFFKIKQDGTILDFKGLNQENFLVAPQKLIGKRIQDIPMPEIKKKFQDAIDQLIKTERMVTIDYSLKLNDQELFYEANFQFMLERLIIVVIRNITERKIIEEQLRFEALHDRLTGLPNRALFLDRLNNISLRAKRDPEFRFAILFIDLDQFKLINDSLGHSLGDQILIKVAEKLKSSIRASDTVARLGGDEFTIILDSIDDTSGVRGWVERIHKALAQPILINDHTLYVSASIGISINTADNYQPEEMLREADEAMYHAKAQGKSSHEFYTRQMHTDTIEHLDMITDLRNALEKKEFEMYYQPIVCLKTGEILRLEALIRWNHPTKGFISPMDFIPVAEETGMIIPIGEWVIKTVCWQTKEWEKQNLVIKPVSINFSVTQLQHHKLPDIIHQALIESNSAPICLGVEITEKVTMNDITISLRSLNKIKDMGIKISIDDFGVGYSSLSCLKVFPIDYIKIDRTFVKNVPNNPHNTAITQAIINLGHSLNLEVVAEGIESKEEFVFLKLHGCDQAQGYLLSFPLPAKNIAELLAKGRINLPV